MNQVFAISFGRKIKCCSGCPYVDALIIMRALDVRPTLDAQTP